jgi:hypothetical protein
MLIKLGFPYYIFEKYPTDRWTDMSKLKVAFHNFVNMPTK